MKSTEGRSEFCLKVSAMKFGKLLPSARYIHRSMLPSAPVEVKLAVERATDLAGLPSDGFDLIKLGTIEPKVSLLRYPEFWTDPFPALADSWSIDMPTERVTHRRYVLGDKTPILHRKETFVAASRPEVPAWTQVTRDLEALGLFKHTATIGQRGVWAKMLKDAGVEVIDGKVLARRGNPLDAAVRTQVVELEGDGRPFRVEAWLARKRVGFLEACAVSPTPAGTRLLKKLNARGVLLSQKQLVTVSRVQVVPEHRDEGLGTALYVATITQAMRYGFALASDACDADGSHTDEDAVRLWQGPQLREKAIVLGEAPHFVAVLRMRRPRRSKSRTISP